MELWEKFDYGKMAGEAGRECRALQVRLAERRRNLPKPGEELRWKQENAMLYAMYLEQRHNWQLFAHRAALRGQPVWENAGGR